MNLIICTTPLQMLIANQLINLKKIQADVLILTYHLNAKYEYYLTKIKNNLHVQNVNMIKIEESNVLTKLMTVRKIQQWCKNQQYNTAYLASIDNFFMHCVLHYGKVQEVYTFDDGTANIIDTSSYFIDKSSQFSALARKILQIEWDLATIKKQTKKHYTIYHNIKNIVDNTEKIDVFGMANVINNKQKNGVCYLFLGQPFDNHKIGLQIYQKLKQNIADIKYFIHPREDSVLIENQLNTLDIIKSDLIFEEYVLQKLNEGYDIELFTMSSSAGFNLYSTKGVKVHFIIETELDAELGEIYKFIKKLSLHWITLD